MAEDDKKKSTTSKLYDSPSSKKARGETAPAKKESAPKKEATPKAENEPKKENTPKEEAKPQSPQERHAAERKGLHGSHEKERRDAHNAFRDQLRAMQERHNTEINNLTERHMSELTGSGGADLPTAGAPPPAPVGEAGGLPAPTVEA